jgi:ArsR family transcriptional regulator
VDDIFRALADPTRRKILRLLRAGDLPAGQIAERFPLAKSTLSTHLKLLRESGLVVTERRGTTIVYSLNVGAHEEALAAVFALLRVGAPRPARRTREGRACV